jgi:hypothetical protein
MLMHERSCSSEQQQQQQCSSSFVTSRQVQLLEAGRLAAMHIIPGDELYALPGIFHLSLLLLSNTVTML